MKFVFVSRFNLAGVPSMPASPSGCVTPLSPGSLFWWVVFGPLCSACPREPGVLHPRSHCRLEKHHRSFKGNLSAVRLLSSIRLLPSCSFPSSSLSCINQLHHPPRAKAKNLARNFLDLFLCLSPVASQFRSFQMIQILKMLANSALLLCFHPSLPKSRLSASVARA